MSIQTRKILGLAMVEEPEPRLRLSTQYLALLFALERRAPKLLQHVKIPDIDPNPWLTSIPSERVPEEWPVVKAALALADKLEKEIEALRAMLIELEKKND